MVFQNYALFPHLTASENIGFGLRARGRPAARGRAPRSGGPRGSPDARRCSSASRTSSRAASASASRSHAHSRAIPTSTSSTSRSRTSTRNFASRCAPSSSGSTGAVGTTMVYVTHDQIEALTLGSRVAVLDDGSVSSRWARPDDDLPAAGESIRRALRRQPRHERHLGRSRRRRAARWAVRVRASARSGTDSATVGSSSESAPSTSQSAPTLRASRHRSRSSKPPGNETFVHMTAGSETLVARVGARARRRRGGDRSCRGLPAKVCTSSMPTTGATLGGLES